PANCGLCSSHLSHTGLSNLVITNRCDLHCWYCFFYAEKAGYIYEPTMDQIREMAINLRAERPVPGNSVQITGGEPTLRDDLPEIIRIIKEVGVDHVQLNTNGIRLSKDFEFFKKIKEAGVSNLYMSFDGVTPKTNPKNHWEVAGVIENAKKLKVGIVLVPTVIKSVNDHELGDIIRFGFKNIEVVRAVNFQPVSLTGRMPKREREKYRITIPDCIIRIEEQTDGMIPRDAWFPVPACTPLTGFLEALTNQPKYELSIHFACGAGTYVFKDGDRLKPITDFVDVEGLIKYLRDKAEEIEMGRSRAWVGMKVLWNLGKFINESKQPAGMNLKRLLFDIIVKHDYKSVGEWHQRSLFLGMMHFMDKYNHDEERLRRCDIHYLTPDMRIIPFCAFNVIPEWYRDRIQAQYGVPIDEWEKRTGRRLADDFYKRKIPVNNSVPTASTKTAGFGGMKPVPTLQNETRRPDSHNGPSCCSG
ncbi:MAG: radical SAM protein, partial [Aigarchaeota archaeon]|nr:radical SAM protein [Aigarchaeota archaeon]